MTALCAIQVNDALTFTRVPLVNDALAEDDDETHRADQERFFQVAGMETDIA